MEFILSDELGITVDLISKLADFSHIVNFNISDAVEEFALFKPENYDIKYFLDNKPKKFKQPFLLILGEPDLPQQFYVVLDDFAVECGDDFLNAFHVLFSSFYVFNLKYPKSLCFFFEFFAKAVFCIEPLTPTVSTLLSLLDSL